MLKASFLKIKQVRFQVSFWGAPTHADIIEFSNFLLQLKNQKPGSKILCGFSIILILKGINDVSKSPCSLLNKNINSIKFNKNKDGSDNGKLHIQF